MAVRVEKATERHECLECDFPKKGGPAHGGRIQGEEVAEATEHVEATGHEVEIVVHTYVNRETR